MRFDSNKNIQYCGFKTFEQQSKAVVLLTKFAGGLVEETIALPGRVRVRTSWRLEAGIAALAMDSLMCGDF